MDSIEYLGLVASSLATLAFLPQVVKTWRTAQCEGLQPDHAPDARGRYEYLDLFTACRAVRRRSGSATASQFALVGLILAVKIKN